MVESAMLPFEERTALHGEIDCGSYPPDEN